LQELQELMPQQEDASLSKKIERVDNSYSELAQIDGMKQHYAYLADKCESHCSVQRCGVKLLRNNLYEVKINSNLRAIFNKEVQFSINESKQTLHIHIFDKIANHSRVADLIKLGYHGIIFIGDYSSEQLE
jgi:hypothetical protein